MAGSIRDIKRRIRSVRNVQQITRAMKMVAAARIRRVELKMKASRPYAARLQAVIRDLAARLDEPHHPLMETRPVKQTGVILVTSDKGLCGAYNSNILRWFWSAWGELRERHGRPPRLLVLGSKGRNFLSRRGVTPDRLHLGWEADITTARQMATTCEDWFVSGEVDEVLCYYTRPVSALVQKPERERILPMAAEVLAGEEPPAPLPYLFEPSVEEALRQIVPQYLSAVLLQLLLESKTAELGARLAAMTNATDNANKLADELTLQFFRLRQDSITREILEIAGGAEALAASAT